ncbi:hypothetical protein BG015_008388 [Linnemannia schmuckeri]|uniref:Uncharacterized protein n=1 Tax=Linnemannia schmuckeri TaxID=64567 RepID=A0A9P5RXJ1_9FUNG|nr:hypothetical protein BG015_008388 [Linnemannia schmuckeri]
MSWRCGFSSRICNLTKQLADPPLEEGFMTTRCLADQTVEVLQALQNISTTLHQLAHTLVDFASNLDCSAENFLQLTEPVKNCSQIQLHHCRDLDQSSTA